MSSSDEDLVVGAMYLMRRKKRKRFWVHPDFEKNYERRFSIIAEEMQDPVKFKQVYRMSAECFDELTRLVGPRIEKKNTRFRKAIGVTERLLITLRYLATGCKYTDLSLHFLRADCTISRIISSTTKAIWETLQPLYMKLPSTTEWLEISDRFQELWNIPNCIGAVDGKHVRIKKIPNSGSTNYNYKGYNSSILMAACDADACFTMIEVGYAGRNSDGGVFRASRMGRWLRTNGDRLNLPNGSRLKYDREGGMFPYYFVADEAFPLASYMMRPYPKRTLNNEKRIFNYRLSRARKTIECAFGMITSKFGVLSTPIGCTNINTVNNIIRSICVLHNFIRKKEGVRYRPTFRLDDEGIGQLPPNDIRLDREPQNFPQRLAANKLRDYLARYFLQPLAALPNQWNYCVNE